MPSDTTVRVSHDGERAGGDGPGEPAVDVRPVERVGDGEATGPGDPARPAGSAELARLHRLVLETRVAALEEQLAHKQRQLEVIRSQYERVVDERGREAREGRGDGEGSGRLLPWSLRR